MLAKQINKLVIKYQKEKIKENKDLIFSQIYKSQENFITLFISDAAKGMGESEDLKQELIIGMLEALNKYKSRMKTNFNTYLMYYLKKARKNWGHSVKTVRVQQKAKNKDIKFVSMENIEVEDSFSWQNFEDKLDLEKKMERLSEKDKEIVDLRIQGYKFSEIADKRRTNINDLMYQYRKIIKILQKE